MFRGCVSGPALSPIVNTLRLGGGGGGLCSSKAEMITYRLAFFNER